MDKDKTDVVPNNTPILYTVDNVAAILQIARRTILQYISDGKLPARKIGREWRVTSDELNAFIQRGTDPDNLKTKASTIKRKNTLKQNKAALEQGITSAILNADEGAQQEFINTLKAAIPPTGAPSETEGGEN